MPRANRCWALRRNAVGVQLCSGAWKVARNARTSARRGRGARTQKLSTVSDLARIFHALVDRERGILSIHQCGLEEAAPTAPKSAAFFSTLCWNNSFTKEIRKTKFRTTGARLFSPEISLKGTGCEISGLRKPRHCCTNRLFSVLSIERNFHQSVEKYGIPFCSLGAAFL